MSFRTVLTDPMLRMLVAAIAVAALLPATGDARGWAQMVANAAIFVLFLLNGMRIARRDIVAGFANWRFLVPLVLWVFGAMALVGLALASIGQGLLAPSVALGFLYLGTLPSTVQSATSYSSLAGGNVALSVVGAALLNILGVFVTVPLFLALGGSGSGAVGMEVIGKIMLLLILPFAIGQAVQGFNLGLHRAAQAEDRLDRPLRYFGGGLCRVLGRGGAGHLVARRGHRLGGNRRAGRRLLAGRQSGRMAGGRRAPPPAGRSYRLPCSPGRRKARRWARRWRRSCFRPKRPASW
jgi:hypothetical protein